MLACPGKTDMRKSKIKRSQLCRSEFKPGRSRPRINGTYMKVSIDKIDLQLPISSLSQKVVRQNAEFLILEFRF